MRSVRMRSKRVKVNTVEDEHLQEHADATASGLNRHCEFNDVLKYIFDHLDMQGIKICRLVCKQWNDEACRTLRNRSVVYLQNFPFVWPFYGNYYKDFMEFLESRSPSLPIPFKAFNVTLKDAGDEVQECIKRILTSVPDAVMTKLRIDGGTCVDLVKGIYSRDLVELIVLHKLPFMLPSTKAKQFKWPLLQSLTIAVDMDEVRKISLGKRLAASAPKLKDLTLTGDKKAGSGDGIDKEFLVKAMSLPNFTPIQTLTLRMSSDITVRDLNGFDTLQNLRSLDLPYFPDDLDADSTYVLLTFLRKFSATIEHLSLRGVRMDSDVVAGEFPKCPNLGYLEFRTLNGVYRSIGPERLPSLRTMAFSQYDIPDLPSCAPHNGVDTIKIFARGTCDLPSAIELCLLQQLFPNCKNLKVPISYAERYCATHRSHPTAIRWNIQKLTLPSTTIPDVATSNKFFETLTGLKVEALEFAESNGLDPFQFISEPSISDLRCLKTLVVSGISLKITDSMIKIGLSRMNLELLQFEWNDRLSVECVVTFLKCIKSLVVTNCCGPRFARQMEALFSQMPSARCGCRLSTKNRFGFKRFHSKSSPAQGFSHLSF